MTSETPVTACVLIIGDEILSGRTQDVNLAHIATELNEIGIQVSEAHVLPDDEAILVDNIRKASERFDYVITTGGIGPTHDDITADCVAKAFGRELEMNEELETLLRRREAPPEIMAARLRMARVPQGGELIRNPNGAHGFRVENVCVLAGIPRVMRDMLSGLLPTLKGAKLVRSRTVTAFVTESQIAGPLGALQQAHPSISLGSYPFSRDGRYGTSLVARGTDEAALDNIESTLKSLVADAGGELLDS